MGDGRFSAPLCGCGCIMQMSPNRITDRSGWKSHDAGFCVHVAATGAKLSGDTASSHPSFVQFDGGKFESRK